MHLLLPKILKAKIFALLFFTNIPKKKLQNGLFPIKEFLFSFNFSEYARDFCD